MSSSLFSEQSRKTVQHYKRMHTTEQTAPAPEPRPYIKAPTPHQPRAKAPKVKEAPPPPSSHSGSYTSSVYDVPGADYEAILSRLDNLEVENRVLRKEIARRKVEEKEESSTTRQLKEQQSKQQTELRMLRDEKRRLLAKHKAEMGAAVRDLQAAKAQERILRGKLLQAEKELERLKTRLNMPGGGATTAMTRGYSGAGVRSRSPAPRDPSPSSVLYGMNGHRTSSLPRSRPAASVRRCVFL